MGEYYIDLNRKFEPSTSFVPFVHFTDSFEKLCKIINEGFLVNYCIETLSNNEREIKAAFPMISLSNLDFEEAKFKLGSYGTFGVALNKNFVEKYRFNPVLYLDRNSDITKCIIDSFDLVRDKFWEGKLENHLFNYDSKTETVLFSRNLLTVFAYSKNYDAELIRAEKLINEDYKFGLEREWRVIHKEPGIKYFLVKEDIENRSEFNKLLADKRYTIDFEDLYEILVETDHEVELMKDILIKKYNSLDVKIRINRRRHLDDEG